MHGDLCAKTLESLSGATDPTEELDKANLIPARPSALSQVGEGGRDGTWVQLLAPARSSARAAPGACNHLQVIAIDLLAEDVRGEHGDQT